MLIQFTLHGLASNWQVTFLPIKSYLASSIYYFDGSTCLMEELLATKPTFKKHHQLLRLVISPWKVVCFPQHTSPYCKKKSWSISRHQARLLTPSHWVQWIFEVQLLFELSIFLGFRTQAQPLWICLSNLSIITRLAFYLLSVLGAMTIQRVAQFKVFFNIFSLILGLSTWD